MQAHWQASWGVSNRAWQDQASKQLLALWEGKKNTFVKSRLLTKPRCVCPVMFDALQPHGM